MHSQGNSDQVQVSAAQASSEQNVHLLDLLIVFAKRRKFILQFTLGAAALAVITVLLLPSKYTAETVVLPPSQNSSMSSALLNQMGGSGGLAAAAGASLGIKNPADLYISLLKSRNVEDAVIQHFGLMERYHVKKQSEARAQLEKHCNVAAGAKDGLITLTLTDHDPKMAAVIANGYIEEYRKFSADLAITEASQRRLFFQQQLLEANESLAMAEDALKNLEQSTGVLEVNSQARSLIESAAELRAQVVAKEVQLQGMRAYAAEDNPDLITAKQQLVALQAQLAKLSGTDRNPGAAIIVPKGNIPEAGMQYLRKLRDVKYSETIVELMAKQFELAKLDEARQGAVLQVVDSAVPPDTRSFPKRTLTVVAATLFGFLLACAWCLLTEGMQRLKMNPDDIQRLDELRVTLRK